MDDHKEDSKKLQESEEHEEPEKSYEDFIPSLRLDFDKRPQEIDNDNDDDVTIVDIEDKIPTIIKIALLLDNNIELNEIEKEDQNYIKDLKSRLNSTMERAIFGNLVNEPFLNEEENAINKPPINQLQNTAELDQIKIEEVKKNICEILMKKKRY